MTKKILYSLILSYVLFFTGCIVVKEKDEIIHKETEVAYESSPKASVKMSATYVVTPAGDMVATLPDGWFFIEPSGSLSSEIFAIAANPDYTMCAVFTHIKRTSELEQLVAQEGLIGLSRVCYAERNGKATGTINFVDNYQILDMKPQKFGYFSYIRQEDNTLGCSATFASNINEYYEYSLVTMGFTLNDVPERKEFDEIFMSILSTLKY
ncbi:MAG: hypothetical protein LBO69_05340 [Ignavibacteria bacterium]|jgi:hypothetical protein|nr:hypothetical protein [Ignavibacteria bacterium]